MKLQIIAVVVGATVLAGSALAQGSDRLRIMEQQKQKDLSATTFLQAPKRDYTAFNFGGWASTTYFNFDENDNNTTLADPIRSLFISDVRAWASWVNEEDFGGYIRLKKLNHDFSTAPGVADPVTTTVDRFDLDLGYFEFNNLESHVRVGRQYLQAGRGLTFSDNLDSISADYTHKEWGLSGFFGRTVPMQDNLDNSIGFAGGAAAERWFFNATVSNTRPSGHRFSAYALVEDDDTTNQNPLTQGADHEYNTSYFGLGWDGPLSRRLNGYAELVSQTGETASQNVVTLPGAFARDPIDSWAFISALQYFLKDRWYSNVSLEFAYGSGDPDRGSVTNTFGVGNTPGTRDKNFNYFGSYDLGLALTPRLSNLEVWRLGYSAKPFRNCHGAMADLQLGIKGSIYNKDRNTGAISSTSATQATLANSHVGSAVDVFAAWKIYKDYSFLAQYGNFDPGSVYAAPFNADQDRLLINLTSSF